MKTLYQLRYLPEVDQDYITLSYLVLTNFLKAHSVDEVRELLESFYEKSFDIEKMLKLSKSNNHKLEILALFKKLKQYLLLKIIVEIDGFNLGLLPKDESVYLFSKDPKTESRSFPINTFKQENEVFCQLPEAKTDLLVDSYHALENHDVQSFLAQFHVAGHDADEQSSKSKRISALSKLSSSERAYYLKMESLQASLQSDSLVRQDRKDIDYKKIVTEQMSKNSSANSMIFPKERNSSYSMIEALTKQGLLEYLKSVFSLNDLNNKTFPSSGGIYDTKVYLLVNQVTELEKGLYSYDWITQTLTTITLNEEHFERLLHAPFKSCPLLTKNPQLIIYLCSDLERLNNKYQNISLKLALINAAVIAQNLHLEACNRKLGNFICGHNFEAKLVNDSLKESEIHLFDLVFPG